MQLNNLPEPATKKQEYVHVHYQMLLKRCENVMAKHIFQYTIKPSENVIDIYV